jgi:hypothetical protein
MQKLAVSAVSLLFLMPFGVAQNAVKPHVDVPAVAARPDDVSSIEAIVKASYETISGGAGVPRQWARERTLNDPNARFVAAVVDAKTGQTRVWSVSDQEFADQADASMVRDGFTEHELGHQIHRYGNVATVLSSYEGKGEHDPKAERGVNIFQLYFDGKRWWILTITWDTEHAGNAIPSELLPKN